ncbi:MAG: ferrochelatase [Nitrospira sp.]|nr:ferrochelatase [Nitrospira sp.]
MTTQSTTGIILLNLGGPDSLTAVRPFLYNLFSDREIIQLGPSFLQKPLAWLISKMRAGKSRAMYEQIGSGSPILKITNLQAAALQDRLNKEIGQQYKVYVGMRYWHPFIKTAVEEFLADGIKDVIVLNLYPHYSKATTGSSVRAFNREIAGKDLNIHYINEWYDFPYYIDALAETIDQEIKKIRSAPFHLLYSAHSLPQSFIDNGDPYLDHIRATIKQSNIRLSQPPYNHSHINHSLSFQSKTGPVKWLEPSTEEELLKLSGAGTKNVLVVPISFVSDHIETLYEIDILYRDIAQEYGIALSRCEAFNVRDSFIQCLVELVKKAQRG